MRHALTYLVLTLISAGSLGDEIGHLLIGAAKYPSESKQPTWIALRRDQPNFGFIHVPAGRGIVNLAPGRYRLVHIDFQESMKSSTGTLRVVNGIGASIDVTADSIRYLGLLEIHRVGFSWDHSEEYRLNVAFTSKILSWACAAEPDVMTRLPVLLTGENNQSKLVQVRCET